MEMATCSVFNFSHLNTPTMPDLTDLLTKMTSLVETRAEELRLSGVNHTDDPVQIMNEIILPILGAAKAGAKRAGWSAETGGTPTDPTVWLRFWQGDAPFAEVMFYPQDNQYVGFGVARSYSKPGSHNVVSLAPLSLNQYHPTGTGAIVNDLIHRALEDDSAG